MKKIIICVFAFVLTINCFSEGRIENNLLANDFLVESIKATGADNEKIEKYEAVFFERTSDFISRVEEIDDADDKAEFALTYCYEKLLKKFKLDQSDICYTLDSGFYNCVSSCIFYVYFLKVMGYEFEVFETDDHVFVEIFVNGNRVRVETTNPYGFNPGEEKHAPESDSYYRATPKNYRNQKLVDDRRLVGMIYSNRVSLLFKKSLYEQAYQIALDSLEIQEYSEEAVDLLDMAGSNLAAFYARKKKNREALDLARKHKEIYGLSTRWAKNTGAAVSNLLNDSFDISDYPAAFEILEAEKDLLTESNYNSMKYTTVSNYINWLSSDVGFDEAMEELNARSDYLKKSDYTTYEKRIKNHEAVRIHNECVPLMNSGEYDKAVEILEAGLEKIGPNSTLQNDLKRIKK